MKVYCIYIFILMFNPAVVRCYKHTLPLVVEVFEGHDEKTQRDASDLAAILSRKTNVSIKY